jgi:ATP-dependent Clp protease ATP-binding subunit ClpB
LRRYLQHTVENLISKKIIAGEVSRGMEMEVDVCAGELIVR